MSPGKQLSSTTFPKLPEPFTSPSGSRQSPTAVSPALDLAAVEAADDVVFVLIAKDIPGLNDTSPNRTHDHPIICAGEIEFHSEVLFAVVARSRHAARRAVRLAQIATNSDSSYHRVGRCDCH